MSLRFVLPRRRGNAMLAATVTLVLLGSAVAALLHEQSTRHRAAGSIRMRDHLEDVRLFLRNNVSCEDSFTGGCTDPIRLRGIAASPFAIGPILVDTPYTRYGSVLVRAKCSVTPRRLVVEATLAGTSSPIFDPLTRRLLNGESVDPSKGIDQGWVDIFLKDPPPCLVP